MEVILVVLIVVNIGLVIFILQKSNRKSEDTASLLIKQDMLKLQEGLNDLNSGLKDHLTERLDKSNDQMVKQYEASAKIIRDVTQKLTELDKTNKQVGDIASELKTLQNVLQNPKQRGGVGEFYLQTVLENVLPPGVFELQYAFKDGEKVDAIIKLDKKILPVDSKFSLENYNRLLEEKDPKRKEEITSLFKSDVKKRIDETAKYIRPGEDTTDFAFMFIPSEAIYYDLLINKVGTANTSARDLIEYAFRDKKVIIVSPTTFLAYLQTVLQGLRSLTIEQQAKDIQKRVGDLGRHIQSYDTYMQKLGNSLSTTVNHYNTAHKELAKVDKDIVKIAQTNSSVEPMLVDRPIIEE
ncbi:MAG: DNA recombination protein RmuC [Candidatus Saccharimonadales bacterium]